MKSLEDVIRAVARAGELTHLSVIAAPRKGGFVFSASVRGATGATAHGDDADPVKAILAALSPKKKGKTDEPDFG